MSSPYKVFSSHTIVLCEKQTENLFVIHWKSSPQMSAHISYLKTTTYLFVHLTMMLSLCVFAEGNPHVSMSRRVYWTWLHTAYSDLENRIMSHTNTFSSCYCTQVDCTGPRLRECLFCRVLFAGSGGFLIRVYQIEALDWSLSGLERVVRKSSSHKHSGGERHRLIRKSRQQHTDWPCLCPSRNVLNLFTPSERIRLTEMAVCDVLFNEQTWGLWAHDIYCNA